MDNRSKWIAAKMRMGWMFLATGVSLVLAGILLELLYPNPTFNLRIITGLGILLAGVGAGYLVRYQGALKNEPSARRLTVEERDERTVQIRTRAGHRAYWASTALVMIGLMWASFAANRSLPDLSGDILWYFLAATVIISFVFYISSILIDQRDS